MKGGKKMTLDQFQAITSKRKEIYDAREEKRQHFQAKKAISTYNEEELKERMRKISDARNSCSEIVTLERELASIYTRLNTYKNAKVPSNPEQRADFLDGLPWDRFHFNEDKERSEKIRLTLRRLYRERDVFGMH